MLQIQLEYGTSYRDLYGHVTDNTDMIKCYSLSMYIQKLILCFKYFW